MSDRSDNPAPGSGGKRPFTRPVDFSAPRALAPDVEARLRRFTEDFCEAVAGRAAIEFSTPVEITPLWLREAPWRELYDLPAAGAQTLVLELSSGGRQFVALDPSFATLVVERLLGSEADPARPMRAITTTDRALLRRVGELVADVSNALWDEAAAVSVSSDGLHPHPDLGAVLEPAERVLCAALEVIVGGLYAVLHLMLPLAAIEPVADRLARPSTRASGDDEQTSRAVHERISHAQLEVRAELPAIRMTARELAALQPGTRIPLGTRAGEPAALLADGVPVQYGHIGKSGNRRAVQIGDPQGGVGQP